MLSALAIAALGLAAASSEDDKEASIEERFRVLYALEKVDAYRLLLSVSAEKMLILLLKQLTNHLEGEKTLEGIRDSLEEIEAVLDAWYEDFGGSGWMVLDLFDLVKTSAHEQAPIGLSIAVKNRLNFEVGRRAGIPVLFDLSRLEVDRSLSSWSDLMGPERRGFGRFFTPQEVDGRPHQVVAYDQDQILLLRTGSDPKIFRICPMSEWLKGIDARPES